MVDDELTQLLGEQIAYYRARANEYDTTEPFAGCDEGPALRAALEQFGPRGSILELACGTGLWTAELARYATRLTAVDAADEMLALNRVRLAHADITYLAADLFAWASSERYDVVFFSAWLSHVPPQRFAVFWELVASCLNDRGRVFVIDELPAVERLEQPLPDAVAPAVERRLRTGDRFRAIKVFYEPRILVAQLAALGWEAQVHPVGWRFYYATAVRSASSSRR